jgi:hypothetical protein
MQAKRRVKKIRFAPVLAIATKNAHLLFGVDYLGTLLLFIFLHIFTLLS